NSLRCCREHTKALVEEFGPDTLWDEYGIVGQLVPFTNDFPCTDIYDLLSPNLLHLVDWVKQYLKMTHGTSKANSILDDIDRCIAAVAPFAGLRRFPQGRHFKQWTGDNSKALMKVSWGNIVV
ncbi:hypothetical protein PAXRUDRAFT_131421, partial [Paxillus rubicundulus Ve08.2h10]